MQSIYQLGNSIESKLGQLTYVTNELNNSITNQLSSIGSSISVNNLLTGIQTYQMYKVNANIKSLNK